MGRRTLDPAVLLRRRIWAMHVRALRDGTSWDRLDDEFVWSRENNSRADQERPRRFYRVFTAGHDPEFAMAHGRPANLVEICAKSDHRLTAAKDAFHSPFWQLLTPPGLHISEMSEAHDAQLDRLGLCQVPSEDWDIFAQIKGSLSPNLSQQMREGAMKLVVIATFDALFILCFQLRDAIDKLSFDAANLYIHFARECLRKISHRLLLPGHVHDELLILTEKRAIRGDWSPVDDLVTGRGRKKQIPKDSAEMMMHLLHQLKTGDGQYVTGIRPSMRPIIARKSDS